MLTSNAAIVERWYFAIWPSEFSLFALARLRFHNIRMSEASVQARHGHGSPEVGRKKNEDKAKRQRHCYILFTEYKYKQMASQENNYNKKNKK